jgi:hypothetical protein
MSPALSREDRAPGSGDGRVVGELAVARCRRRREAFSRGFAPNRIGRMGLARTRQGENARQGSHRSPSRILKHGGIGQYARQPCEQRRPELYRRRGSRSACAAPPETTRRRRPTLCLLSSTREALALDHMPVLTDTGIKRMILWVSTDSRPPGLTANSALRDGVSVSVSVPAQDPGTEPALQYAFVTGGARQPMAPSEVDWRVGHGINTGRNVLAGADYLYDAMAGRVGFRVPPR